MIAVDAASRKLNMIRMDRSPRLPQPKSKRVGTRFLVHRLQCRCLVSRWKSREINAHLIYVLCPLKPKRPWPRRSLPNIFLNTLEGRPFSCLEYRSMLCLVPLTASVSPTSYFVPCHTRPCTSSIPLIPQSGGSASTLYYNTTGVTTEHQHACKKGQATKKARQTGFK